MQNGSEQAGVTSEVEFLCDIAELLVLILNCCDLSTAEKLEGHFQLRDWLSSLAN